MTEKPQSSMAFTFTHTSGEVSTYACINDVVYAVILLLFRIIVCSYMFHVYYFGLEEY